MPRRRPAAKATAELSADASDADDLEEEEEEDELLAEKERREWSQLGAREAALKADMQAGALWSLCCGAVHRE